MTRSGGGSSGSGGRPNSLRLNRRQLEEVLDRIDAPERSGSGFKKRLYLRTPFRHASVRLVIVHPGGNHSEFRVACRNLSAGGVSVLHSAFVYPGSECRVWLPHPRLQEVEVVARVVRCTHVEGMIHELGLKFDQAIQVKEFVPSTAPGALTLERVEPQRLAGRLLHVEESDLDQRLVRHFLRESRVEVTSVAGPTEAAAAAGRGCDVALCGAASPNADLAPVIEAVRRAAPAAPVLAAFPEPAGPGRARAEALGVSLVIAKPYTQATLLRALGEVLLLRRGGAAGAADTAGAGDAGSLPEGFASDLRGVVDRISKAQAGGDTMACYLACTQLKGAAQALGLGAIGDMADKAAASLSGTNDLGAAGPLLAVLVDACRAQLPQAA